MLKCGALGKFDTVKEFLQEFFYKLYALQKSVENLDTGETTLSENRSPEVLLGLCEYHVEEKVDIQKLLKTLMYIRETAEYDKDGELINAPGIIYCTDAHKVIVQRDWGEPDEDLIIEAGTYGRALWGPNKDNGEYSLNELHELYEEITKKGG